MGQREGQVLGKELLDVGALDIVRLLELDDAEDLEKQKDISLVLPVDCLAPNSFDRMIRTWMDRKRAR